MPWHEEDDGIRTINVVRRRDVVADLERLGADAVVVCTEGPLDEQVRRIVGPQGVKYALDPVVGETGTQMYQALGDEGRMPVYGSLTGAPNRCMSREASNDGASASNVHGKLPIIGTCGAERCADIAAHLAGCDVMLVAWATAPVSMRVPCSPPAAVAPRSAAP